MKRKEAIDKMTTEPTQCRIEKENIYLRAKVEEYEERDKDGKTHCAHCGRTLKYEDDFECKYCSLMDDYCEGCKIIEELLEVFELIFCKYGNLLGIKEKRARFELLEITQKAKEFLKV